MTFSLRNCIKSHSDSQLTMLIHVGLQCVLRHRFCSFCGFQRRLLYSCAFHEICVCQSKIISTISSVQPSHWNSVDHAQKDLCRSHGIYKLFAQQPERHNISSSGQRPYITAISTTEPCPGLMQYAIACYAR